MIPPDRTRFLTPPKRTLNRRRVAVAGGAIKSPTLKRTISAPQKSWPGAVRPKQRRESEMTTASLLEMLVTAAYHGDSETDEDDDMIDESLESNPLPEGWLKKGRRMQERERRAKRVALMRRKSDNV